MSNSGDLVGRFWSAVADPGTWSGIGVAFVVLLGAWVAGHVVLVVTSRRGQHRRPIDAFGSELAIGVIVATCAWAAVRSGGASVFTPVALAFAGVILFGAVGWLNSSHAGRLGVGDFRLARRWRPWMVLVGAGSVVLVTGLLYRMTMAVPGGPEGQPIDFLDPAYYAVLGRELAATGLEDPFSSAGLPLNGVAPQAWYHWGEIWFASGVGVLAGIEPMLARHVVALPVLLVATATMTGTLVRRWTGLDRPLAFVLGFVCCLVLSPIPVLADVYFGSYASGMLFGIVAYGFAAVIVARLVVDAIDIAADGPPDWSYAALVGTTAAALLPAHFVIAGLGLVGLAVSASVWVVLVRPSRERMRGAIGRWFRPAVVAVMVVTITLAWGLLTGHGIGGSAPSRSVSPFNETWARSILSVIVGSGLLLTLPVAAVILRRRSPGRASAYAGGVGVLLAGAVAWGALLPDYNTFHLFFAGLATIATPLAAAAIVDVWAWLRASGRRFAASVVVAAAICQLAIASVFTVAHMQRFGPFDYDPIPAVMLDHIRSLPKDAKIAYRCALDEQSVWLPRLISVNAHTARPMVPMCFQADLGSKLIGATVDTTVEHPAFRLAPQRDLYPTRDAQPPRAAVLAFLATHGIDYILADPTRPNTLLPDAPVVFRAAGYSLYRLP